MQCITRFLLGMATCGVASLSAFAQCPPRPNPDTIVQDAPSIYSQNGVLKADLTLGHSVDINGYTHYCYIYQTATGVVEAPTLRLNPGDRLLLHVKDNITGNDESVSAMDMPSSGAKCGDAGMATLNSTNVHFHGMNVPPTCHQDDVLTTLIQPGTPGFQFDLQVPGNEPPGLYWYHPHVHGFTEFQVNGGAAGAIVIEGMDKLRPEVAGLPERVFTVRQQFLVPWVPGPYQLTFNFQQAGIVQGPSPIITMKPGEKQFWRILNATLQDFMPLQVWVNGEPQPLELIALDGYPLAQPRTQKTILIPPAGRAEFIVQAPPAGTQAYFYTLTYPTGLTGNPDIIEPLAKIQLSNSAPSAPVVKTNAQPVSLDKLKFSGLLNQSPTAERKLYFSEEFGGTNGPIQFYITVDGQKQKVFQPNEDPAIVTQVGAVEDWTIENRALETHDFHIHQIHFQVLEVDGKPVATHDLRDSIEIPFWSGSGPYPSVKVRMDFRDPNTAGTFVFHCHILLHEDLGMMHKILVKP